MQRRYSKIAATVGFTLFVIMGWSGVVRAQWTAVGGAPNASTCLQLTDGTVMCQQGEQTRNWQRLTPDAFGSYTSGAWSAAASLPANHCPLYYASAVLADGRLVLIGGEYNCGAGAVESNLGSIYDPVADTWTSITAPETKIGDSDSVVLPDGRFILRHLFSPRIAQFNPATLDFTQLNATGRVGNNSEENSVLLPDGTVLSVDAGIQGGTGSQIYDPATNSWSSAGSTQVSLPNNGGMGIVPELGPGVLRPDGTVVWFGSTSHNAIYDTAVGTWAATAEFPIVGGVQQLMFDAPAALLPNGNILVATSGAFTNPYHTFEFTTANAFVATTADPPGSGGFPSYQIRMLVLPTGEVLLTDSSNSVQTYATAASVTFQDAWRPVITSGPHSVDPGTTYVISGRQFNGLSQASMYGDDSQAATNYPLVRITNRTTGHVFYARTHDHSSMGVATGNTIVSTQFDTPAGLEAGLSDLFVVANGIPSQPFVINGPGLTLPGPLSLTTCLGTSTTATLNVCNTGKLNLSINNITSSDPQFSVNNPGYSITISPDFCFPFQLKFTPTQTGTTNAVLTIASNDPNSPTATLEVTGTAPAPSINAIMVNGGDFGSVCRGDQAYRNIQITNQSTCDLVISKIQSDSADFLTPDVTLPLRLVANATVSLPITFKPAGLACSNTNTRSGKITITSNDPVKSPLQRIVRGVVPCPSVRITGSTSFGDVCAGAQAEKDVSVCNVGECDLNVSSVAFVGDCPDFTLVNNPFPASVSPDSCESVTIRFTPKSCGEKSCTLRINSDDPDGPVVDLTVTANTPCNDIDVSPDQCFSPTVIQSVGACNTLEPFPISNKGSCPIKIPSIALSGANSNAYFLSGLPSFPINLQPGHSVGDGDLDIGFAPLDLGRDTLASIDVTYETDPITHAKTVETRLLNGEGVRTGARVLVTHNNVAVPLVSKLMIQRITGNRNRRILDTVDNAMNLKPITVTPATPCGSFQYHREYSTVSNPIQLLPGSYQITATAVVNGKKQTKAIGFDVGTCGFNANIVIELP